jgi:predicted MFS family arabinose efflux permease
LCNAVGLPPEAGFGLRGETAFPHRFAALNQWLPGRVISLAFNPRVIHAHRTACVACRTRAAETLRWDRARGLMDQRATWPMSVLSYLRGLAPAARSNARRPGTLERFIGLSSRSRRVISEHRQKRRQRDREVSDQSRRGLDWTNFFLADVQMGFGSFLAFYLADMGWSKQNVGLALTVGGLAGVLTQIPGGALVDAMRWKRGLAASGIMAIGAAALMLAFRPSFHIVFVAEILHGVTAGIVGTAIAAISLGLAGRRGMSSRVGRNYRFAAAGNALTAAMMGALGTYIANSAIFVATALLCIPALITLGRIRADEIDYIRARNATKRDHSFSLQRVIDLGKNGKLLLFAGCLVLFHFSNASLLPLVSQNLGQSKEAWGPLFMAGLVIGPQVIVALLAPWVGYWSELWGRKPLLLAGFSTEALRGVLFTFVTDPSQLLFVQLLDGITGAIVTVLTILIIADLTTGTGRFNLTQGVMGTLTGVAAAISTGVTGFIVQQMGDVVGFLSLAGITCVGLAALWMLLPETKPGEYAD